MVVDDGLSSHSQLTHPLDNAIAWTHYPALNFYVNMISLQHLLHELVNLGTNQSLCDGQLDFLTFSQLGSSEKL